MSEAEGNLPIEAEASGQTFPGRGEAGYRALEECTGR
jgi:hypothetical protein